MGEVQAEEDLIYNIIVKHCGTQGMCGNCRKKNAKYGIGMNDDIYPGHCIVPIFTTALPLWIHVEGDIVIGQPLLYLAGKTIALHALRMS